MSLILYLFAAIILFIAVNLYMMSSIINALLPVYKVLKHMKVKEIQKCPREVKGSCRLVEQKVKNERKNVKATESVCNLWSWR